MKKLIITDQALEKIIMKEIEKLESETLNPRKKDSILLERVAGALEDKYKDDLEKALDKFDCPTTKILMEYIQVTKLVYFNQQKNKRAENPQPSTLAQQRKPFMTEEEKKAYKRHCLEENPLFASVAGRDKVVVIDSFTEKYASRGINITPIKNGVQYTLPPEVLAEYLANKRFVPRRADGVFKDAIIPEDFERMGSRVKGDYIVKELKAKRNSVG